MSIRYVVPRVRYSSVPLGRVVEGRLDDFLAGWFGNDGQGRIAILGDSGVGKSSACVYISWLLLRAAASTDSLTPVYLTLDGLARQGLLGSSVHAILQHQPHLGLSEDEVELLVRTRQFGS
jgi:hypothetical protein